jgi:hypothetical protein
MAGTCALCGEPILDNADGEDAHSDEHVPPRQFYPKSMRTELRQPLWKVPSHKRCNGSYKLDEELFYHYFYPLVGFQNETVGKLVLDDLKRQAKKPQSQGLIRRMLKECKRVTPGGLLLPPSLVRFEYDPVRVQRVAIKIAQCLFHKDHRRFMPGKNCKHIELCENPEALPEVFDWLGQTERQAVEPNIFSYWHAEIEACIATPRCSGARS